MHALIDMHIHLQDAAFDADRDVLLARARDAGVSAWVCNGLTVHDWPLVAGLAVAYQGVVPCFGLHPWYVAEAPDDWLDCLEAQVMAMPSAIGEIGLDRWIEPRDEMAMERAFRLQLALARRLHRPVMVHCLRAWTWLIDVLRDEEPPAAGMLIHAYGGSADLIRVLEQMGAYFSFAGNTFEPRRTKARAAMAAVRRDRLLIETDAPDMPPPGAMAPDIERLSDGRRRNEPASLAAVFNGVAQLLSVEREELAAILHNNARRLLGGLMPAAT